ncbi:prolipoprotein diacylglyceryl transferase [Nocardioides alkalitolerans]|uniref:prolipoprotein diacylglyceryl transferase n=1 Tax=Nocardioides alkalitolerans TaxID=281714 RepID=UPI000694A8E1|nr:prolipoprotein diacylglyceryl transferase [Nocardioides alkalitolerans]
MLTALLGSAALIPLSIPSPSEGVWNIGPLPIRGYALCIIAGVILAVWIGERRWVARGGTYGDVQDIAIWAVPFGLVGARAYHVATDWELYFGEGRRPIEALYLWNGGLGIWGAIALGAVGAWIGARRKGVKFLPLADALAPGILVAQAAGRWGNWFNQELFGKPTDQPWGLEIDPEFRPAGYVEFSTFHPTFLYECLWNLAAFAIIIALDRRFRLGHGRVLALYVAFYTAGRGWNEMLRIDDVQLNDVLGLRFNVWTSILLFAAAAVYLVVTRGRGREEQVYVDGAPALLARAEAEKDAEAADASTDETPAGTARGTDEGGKKSGAAAVTADDGAGVVDVDEKVDRERD